MLQIIPSIDLRDGKVVRLKQGDYTQQLNYDVDPIATAKSFAEAGATLMHVVDLDGAKEGRPVQLELIGEILRAASIQVQVGGGVRSTEDVQRLLDAGASRVVVGTRAMEDWAWFDALAHSRGMEQRVILALDAKAGMVATRGWTQTSTSRATDVAKKVSNWPLAAILYTDIAKDGMLTGPNLPETRAVAEAGNVPVIASGGVGNLDHIRQLREIPVCAAIVGRSLYEGTIDLHEAIAVAQAREI